MSTMIDTERKRPRLPGWLFLPSVLLIGSYLQTRLHDVGKLTNPTAAALGFLVSCLLVHIFVELGKLKGWKAVGVYLLGSIIIYVIGRLFGW